MQNNSYNFTIDDYEKSTKEFEKYVNTIPKKVPLKLSKANTIPSLVKDFIHKSQFSETEELCILGNILTSVQQWAYPQKPPSSSEKIISLALRHDELSKQQSEIISKIESLSEEVEFKSAETNGFSSVSEVEDVISMLKQKIGKPELKTKDTEKIVLQIQELKDLIPLVKKIENLIDSIEVLEREKELLSEYIGQTYSSYEDLVKKSNSKN